MSHWYGSTAERMPQASDFGLKDQSITPDQTQWNARDVLQGRPLAKRHRAAREPDVHAQEHKMVRGSDRCVPLCGDWVTEELSKLEEL